MAAKIEGEIDLTLDSDSEEASSAHVAEPPHSTQWRKGQLVRTAYGYGSVYKDCECAPEENVTVLLQWDASEALWAKKAKRRAFTPVVSLPSQSASLRDASEIKAMDFRLAPSPGLPKGFSVSLTRADAARLWPGIHLNDTLIDTFLHRFFFTGAMVEKKLRTHVFSTFFYPYVLSRKRQDIAKWTKHVDLFNVDYIVMPINHGVHWSLTIVCRPFLIKPRTANDASRNDDDDQPVILKLDSTKGHKTQQISHAIRAWLLDEWNARNAPVSAGPATAAPPLAAAPSAAAPSTPTYAAESVVDTPASAEAAEAAAAALTAMVVPAAEEAPDVVEEAPVPGLSAKDLVVFSPDIPLQDNDCDCGVFVLVYAEKFFAEMAPSFECKWKNVKGARPRFPGMFGAKWFNGPELVAQKRVELLCFINETAANNNGALDVV